MPDHLQAEEKRAETASEERGITEIREGGIRKAVVAGDNHSEVQKDESRGETEFQHDIPRGKKQGTAWYNGENALETSREAEKRTQHADKAGAHDT
jgi:hypothetical protein